MDRPRPCFGAVIEERLRFFSRYRKLCGFSGMSSSRNRTMIFMLAARGSCAGVSRLREFGFAYDMLIYPEAASRGD